MAAEGDVLLERAAERKAIGEALAATVEGRGAGLIVAGAAGIGKTDLLQELRTQAAQRSVRVLHAAGSPLETGFSFGIATELLADAVRADRGLLAGAAAFAGTLFDPEPLTDKLVGPEPTAGTPFDPEPVADRPDSEPVAAPGADAAVPVIHGLHWLVENLVDRGPVALVVDDCHWADEPSDRRQPGAGGPGRAHR